MANLFIPNPATQDQIITALQVALLAKAFLPPVVTVLPLVPASTTYTYIVVARANGSTVPSVATSTTTGAASLASSTPNTISWTALQGSPSVAYDVYRSVGGSTQGLIASGLTTTSLVDSGLVGDTTVAPALNSSGVLVVDQTQELAASGAITISGGKVLITSSTTAALTLALPVAGLPAAGGQDGTTLLIIPTTAHAHTVTTPANGINGANDTVTFSGTLPNSITLTAYNGKWYSSSATGATLSEV